MKESLESARNIHQILIVVCTIIAAFSLASLPGPNVYEQARTELNSYEKKFKQELDSTYIRITYDSTGNKIYGQAEIRQFEIDSLWYIINNRPSPTFDFFSKYDRKRLAEIAGEIRDAEKEMDTTEVEGDGEWYKYLSQNLTDLYLERDRLRQSIKGEKVKKPAPVTKIIKKKEAIPQPMPYDESRVTLLNIGQFWSDRMYSPAFEKIITDDKDFEYFLRLNEHRSVKEFKMLLMQQSAIQAKKPDTELDFGGLKVATKTINVLAPFIVLALAIYLTALIGHLGEIMTLREHADTAYEFPWMGGFTGPISRIICVISVTVYPFFAARSPSEVTVVSDTSELILSIFTFSYPTISLFLVITIFYFQTKMKGLRDGTWSNSSQNTPSPEAPAEAV